MGASQGHCCRARTWSWRAAPSAPRLHGGSSAHSHPVLPLAAPRHHPLQPLPAPGRALQTLWLYPAPCHVPLPASSPGTEIADPLPKSTNSRGKMRWQSLLLLLMRVLGIMACHPLPSLEGDGAHPETLGYFCTALSGLSNPAPNAHFSHMLLWH